MDLQTSSFDLNILKGALLIRPDGEEFRLVSFVVYPNDVSTIYALIKPFKSDGFETAASHSWDSLSEWTLQVQAGNN